MWSHSTHRFPTEEAPTLAVLAAQDSVDTTRTLYCSAPSTKLEQMHNTRSKKQFIVLDPHASFSIFLSVLCTFPYQMPLLKSEFLYHGNCLVVHFGGMAVAGNCFRYVNGSPDLSPHGFVPVNCGLWTCLTCIKTTIGRGITTS